VSEIAEKGGAWVWLRLIVYQWVGTDRAAADAELP